MGLLEWYYFLVVVIYVFMCDECCVCLNVYEVVGVVVMEVIVL